MQASDDITKNWLSSIGAIFDLAEFAIAIIDSEFRIVYSNAVLEKTFGKVSGKRCLEYFNGRKDECPWCNLKKVCAGESQKWEWSKAPTGRVFEILDSLIKDPSGRAYKLSLFYDVTGRKKTEIELANAANRYRDSCELLEQTFASLQEAVIIVDPSGGTRRILDCNAGAEKMFGYSRDELIGQETLLLHVDYQKFKNFSDGAAASFAAGRSYETHSWMKRKNGEIFPTEHFVRPMFDASGKLQKNVSVIRDVTERERAEEDRRRMQDQVHQASKLAAIGTLVAGVAHEINNPLTVIRGNLDVLGDIVSRLGIQDKNLKQFLSIQESAIEQISGILKGLLDHVRRDPEESRAFDVHEAVQDTVALVNIIYRKQNVRIVMNLRARNSRVFGAIGKMQQVIMNLLVNAKEAIEERRGAGEIFVETLSPPDSNEMVLLVRDTGCGIASENLEKIFGFFFTTKGSAKGTGLGLSISNSIIQGMGGRIEVSSEVGRGTTFTVRLPVGAE